MKTNNQPQTTQGFTAQIQVYLNDEKQVLVHRLSDDLRIEMPINLYKKILGLPFEKKVDSQEPATRKGAFGLIARPSIYLSKDGQYLIHRVLGIKIAKHVNYYKKVGVRPYLFAA